MEEAGDGGGEGAVMGVDEGFQGLDSAGQRDDVIICYGGWDETTVALGEGDGVLGLTIADLIGSLHAHVDDKASVFHHVTVEGFVATGDTGREMGGVDDEF